MKRFFIIGNPRSGTTLLRLMLNKHSKISVPPEAGFLVWLYDEYKNFSYTNSGVDKFIGALKKTTKIEHWNLNYAKLTSYIYDRKPGSYAILMDCVYQYFTEQNLSKFVDIYGDKNNFYLNAIDLLSDVFEDAKFVHIVRDGRSVAASYIGLNKKSFTSEYAPDLPVEITKIAAEWRGNITTINTSLSKLESEKYHTVRFEDLILDPVSSLQKICDFLGTDYDDEMLKYFQTTPNDGLEPVEFLQWKSKNMMPLQKDEVLKYKELSPTVLDVFEKIASDTLSYYQYK